MGGVERVLCPHLLQKVHLPKVQAGYIRDVVSLPPPPPTALMSTISNTACSMLIADFVDIYRHRWQPDELHARSRRVGARPERRCRAEGSASSQESLS